jgi:hypothetical protein
MGTVSDAIHHRSVVAGPGFPRMALGLAWLATALVSGLLGRLIDGLPAQLLFGLGVLGFAALAAVVSNRHRGVTLRFSTLASVAVIAVGVVAAALGAITGDVGIGTAVAVGAVTLAGGLLANRLSSRARRMAE